MKYLTVNGYRVPALGLGTYLLNGKACIEAVSDAIDVGYRHIDTAVMYGNEAAVGEGIHKSDISRKELFITTKLWPGSFAPVSIRKTTEESLKKLKTDYLDLLLIHWPDTRVPLEESLGTMDELRQVGKVRYLGVSNFSIDWMKRVEETGIRVITNQVEYHVLLSQEKLLSWLREKDIFLTAYSPLAKGHLVDHPVLNDIGKKHDKTGTQVALRWLIQQEDVAAVPKAASPGNRRKNFHIFDFQLDSEDLERIARLEKDQRFIDMPGMSPEWD